MTPAATGGDSLTGTLADIRGRVEAATEGPWLNNTNTWHGVELLDATGNNLLDGDDSSSGAGFFNPHDAIFTAHARTDLPELLGAVEAVVALHTVDDGYYGGQVCEMCDFERFPCPTIRALNTARGVEG